MEDREEALFEEELENRNYICPICNKKFMLPLYMSPHDYVYTISVYDSNKKKATRRKCCSYSCFRKGSKKTSK